jgi:hypothetical protein
MSGGRERTTPARIWYACFGASASGVAKDSSYCWDGVESNAAVAVDARRVWRRWLRHDEQMVPLSGAPRHCQLNLCVLDIVLYTIAIK